jgi:sugar phosphate isomerase/epimerase
LLSPALALAASGGLRAQGARFDAPLSFQVHTLRRLIQERFDQALLALRQAGFSGIEMASFPGFAGNAHGDFGALANVPPRELNLRIHAAGLRCKACLFLPDELLDPGRLDATLAWAHELGIEALILTGLVDFPDRSTVEKIIERIQRTAARVRAAGFLLSIHTDQSQWASLDGRTIVAQLLAGVPSASASFELDLGGVVAYGLDPAALLTAHPGRFQALHLRDGRRPADPSAYVPSCPPGEGEVDFAHLLPAARRAGIRDYVVEMESHTGNELRETAQAYTAFRAMRW